MKTVMISLKCKNCGGEMSVSLKGELLCPYCGSNEQLSDVELDEYRVFRTNVLHYLRAAADRNADAPDGSILWTCQQTAVYHTAEGARISIDYLFYAEDDGVKLYTAKDSVVFVFGAEGRAKASAMSEKLGLLQYPSAALKDLRRCFPTIKARFELDDGGVLIAAAKPENVFPLFAYGSIPPVHAAWIVSRLENICCILEYSGLVHGGIHTDSVFLNTKTHEAFLYGGWWKAGAKQNEADRRDLYALRTTADRVMGEYRNEAPQQFREFLKNKPAPNAYEDFEKWDEVIEKGFGGHKFEEFRS